VDASLLRAHELLFFSPLDRPAELSTLRPDAAVTVKPIGAASDWPPSPTALMDSDGTDIPARGIQQPEISVVGMVKYELILSTITLSLLYSYAGKVRSPSKNDNKYRGN